MKGAVSSLPSDAGEDRHFRIVGSNTPQPEMSDSMAEGPTVLLVDDDEHLRNTLALRFRRHSIRVETAKDGQEAYQFIRSGRRIDLVLTDFMMPNLNGIELLRLLKTHVSLFDTKVLVMSNNSDPGFRKRAVEIGAVDYVFKEIGARAIVEKALKVAGFPQSDAKGAEESPAEGCGPACSVDGARLREIQLLADNTLDMLAIARQVEHFPPAALAAVTSAERLVREIRNRAS